LTVKEWAHRLEVRRDVVTRALELVRFYRMPYEDALGL
jgi:hypothetical protein